MRVVCGSCGVPFEAQRSTARYCSARCRVRAAGARKLQSVDSPSMQAPTVDSSNGVLAASVDTSVAAMHWLTDSDQALVQSARRLAADLDATTDPMTVARIAPQLMTALVALGGTPASRRALGVEREVKGKLAELRAARGHQAG